MSKEAILRRLILFAMVPVSVGAVLLLTLSPAGATPLGPLAAPGGMTGCQAPAQATACRHVRIEITQLATHRTNTSVLSTQRVTVRVSKVTGRLQASCLLHEEIQLKTRKRGKVLGGRTWTDTCTGALDCIQTADLQEQSPTDPDSWVNVENGSTEYGCVELDYAWANADCRSTGVYNTYRTRGIFTIYWDNGEVFGPKDEYTGGYSIPYACEGSNP